MGESETDTETHVLVYNALITDKERLAGKKRAENRCSRCVCKLLIAFYSFHKLLTQPAAGLYTAYSTTLAVSRQWTNAWIKSRFSSASGRHSSNMFIWFGHTLPLHSHVMNMVHRELFYFPLHILRSNCETERAPRIQPYIEGTWERESVRSSGMVRFIHLAFTAPNHPTLSTADRLGSNLGQHKWLHRCRHEHMHISLLSMYIVAPRALYLAATHCIAHALFHEQHRFGNRFFDNVKNQGACVFIPAHGS